MKKLMIAFTSLLVAFQLCAQTQEDINKKNSWLKAGVSLSAPVGNISDYSSFAMGLEISGQFMETRHFGIGIASGYTYFFPKNNADGFGIIPLGLMLRYYPEYKGFFIGTDLGYSFVTNVNSSTGGFYLKPQLGYHNYDWNLYVFYNDIMRSYPSINIQNFGLAATYNIRFKK